MMVLITDIYLLCSSRQLNNPSNQWGLCMTFPFWFHVLKHSLQNALELVRHLKRYISFPWKKSFNLITATFKLIDLRIIKQTLVVEQSFHCVLHERLNKVLPVNIFEGLNIRFVFPIAGIYHIRWSILLYDISRGNGLDDAKRAFDSDFLKCQIVYIRCAVFCILSSPKN